MPSTFYDATTKVILDRFKVQVADVYGLDVVYDNAPKKRSATTTESMRPSRSSVRSRRLPRTESPTTRAPVSTAPATPAPSTTARWILQ